MGSLTQCPDSQPLKPALIQAAVTVAPFCRQSTHSPGATIPYCLPDTEAACGLPLSLSLCGQFPYT